MMQTKKVILNLFIPLLRGQMSYVRTPAENYWKHYPKSPVDEKVDEGNARETDKLDNIQIDSINKELRPNQTPEKRNSGA